MTDMDSTSAKLHDALSRIVRDERSAMVSKWVTLMEVIDEDGGTSMWSMTSDGLSMWDRLGMVEFHSRLIQPDCGCEEEEEDK